MVLPSTTGACSEINEGNGIRLVSIDCLDFRYAIDLMTSELFPMHCLVESIICDQEHWSSVY